MMPREQKYVLVMILTLAYLSAIRLNILSKRKTFLSSYMNPAMKKLSTFVCGYLDEPHLSMQNVCLLFIFFFLLDFDMEWQQLKPAAETTQPRKRDVRCSSLCC